ncbi:MAG: PQQ-dependent sugar dehydrogenase [Bacteroidetes bacterium]|nr:PQQ-dependent sugar dehydrogenase [Bacteroidota bacterium]
MPAFGDALTTEQVDQLIDYLQYGFQNFQKYEFEDEAFTHGTFESGSFKFILEKVASGLEIPWGMAFLPDGSMLITEKKGTLIHLTKDGTKIKIRNVPVVISRGQGGMLDMELHPDYTENGWIYLSYSAFREERGDVLSTTAVSRYRLQDDELVDEELIFEAQDYAFTRHHYGCRLEFDRNGYLYISIGDRGARDLNPQDLKRYPGKIHRLNDDGTIPQDNPFYGQEGIVQSIYTYGHRNTQGMVLHPQTGDMWTHEHGPRGGDEINVLQAGANYGWPVVSYGINYDGTVFTDLTEKEGMENPLHYWVPSIAPCGMDFVTSDRYPAWKGHLLVGSLRFSYLNLCYLENGQVASEEILLKNIGRLRNVKEGPDGYIYVAVEGPGRIYKLVPVQ